MKYLKLVFRGEGAALLHAVQITNANYRKDQKILAKRYQNEHEIIYTTLDCLFNHSNLQESAPGFRRLLDTTCKSINTLEILKWPVNHADVVLVYWL